MRANEFVTESFIGKNKSKIYNLLINTIDSGPFDGGCVVFARALQMKLGGDMVVLTGHAQRDTDEVAQHAALLLNNELIDADGAANSKEFIRRFEQNELTHAGGRVTGVRPIQPDDLPDAPRSEELAQQIEKLL